MTSKAKYNFLIITLLFLLSTLIFSQTIHNQFIWDSQRVILEDQRTASLPEAMRFFSEAYTVPDNNDVTEISGGLKSVKYYRPVVGVFHAVEKHLFGTNPAPYKTVNLLLNAIVTVLAFFVVLHVTNNRFIATIASVLYACNPTKTEVVYWVYSDSHILVTLFLLSSFLLYAKKKPALSILLFIFALFSQENAVLLPFIILGYELFIKRRALKNSLLSLVPYVSLAVMYLFVRFFVVGGIPTGVLTIPEKMIAATVLFQRYIKIYFLTDSPVTAYHFTPDILSYQNPETLISLFVVIVALIIFSLLLRHKHNGAFWCIWFVVWLSVSMNTGGLGDYFMAEKGLYLSGLGLCVLLSYGMVTLLKNRTAILSLVIAFSTFHASQTYARAIYWKDTVTYLESALVYDPDFAFYRYALGVTYIRNNRHQDALNLFLPLAHNKYTNPYDTLGLVETYFSLGNYIYSSTGNAGSAIEAYEHSLAYKQNQPRVYNNAGNVWLMEKEYVKAAEYYKKAITLEPRFLNAYYNLALAYQGAGQQADASAYFEKYRQLSGQVPH